MRWLSAPAAARALAAAAVLAAAAGSGVLAHEGRSSTGYDVVVGFLHEPAYEGYLNAVFLEITGKRTSSKTPTSRNSERAERTRATARNAKAIPSTTRKPWMRSPKTTRRRPRR